MPSQLLHFENFVSENVSNEAIAKRIYNMTSRLGVKYRHAIKSLNH